MDRTRQLNKRKARRFVELLKDILHKFDIRDGADHFGLLLFSNKSEVGIQLEAKVFNPLDVFHPLL